MFTRLLAGSVLGKTLVTFSPAAHAQVLFTSAQAHEPFGFQSTRQQAVQDILQGERDILQGDRLTMQGISDLLRGRVLVGESDISKGFQLNSAGEAYIAEGEHLLPSPH